MRAPTLFLLVSGAATAGAACGNDGSVNATFSSNVGGAGGSSGEGAGPASSSVSSTHASSSSTSSSASTGGTGGTGGGGAGGTGGTGGTGGACDYTSPNNCAGAEMLANINGDSGNDTVVAHGSTSKWFQVFVNDSLTPASMISYTATLQSPAGLDFDLYVYEGSNSAPDCFTSAMHGTGTPATVHDSWNDAFGPDDSRTLSVEVRYVSGEACGSAAEWTLTVEGNTP